MKFIKYVTRFFLAASFIFSATIHAIPVPDSDGNSGAWITTFYASSSFAKVGKPVAVQWSSAFTVGCAIWTSQSGSRIVATSGNTTVTPSSASTLSVRLSCTGTNGKSVSQTRSFKVNKADHPELISLQLNSTSVTAGYPITLSWSSSYSDYCELTGTNFETLPANGSQEFYALPGLNKFNMVCKKYDGRTSQMMSKWIAAESPFPQIYSLYAYNQDASSYYVGWESNSEYCVLDGFTVGSSGAQFYWSSGYNTGHSLTCFKNGYTDSRNITYFPSNANSGSTGCPGFNGGCSPLLNQLSDSEPIP